MVIGLTLGCNESPLPGIEVANPDLEAESVRIVPETGNETYELRLLNEVSASVDQLETGEEKKSLLDSVVVPYSRIGASITVRATFSNARRIVISTTFGTAGAPLSGVLQVDGFQTAACFEIPGQSPSCGGPDNTESSSPSETALEIPNSDSGEEVAEAPEAVIGDAWSWEAEEGTGEESSDSPMMAAPPPSTVSSAPDRTGQMAMPPPQDEPQPTSRAATW